MKSGDAVKVIKTFYDAYLVRRDLKNILVCLTDEIQWVGTGEREFGCGRSQVEQMLCEEFIQEPDPCRITYEHIVETAVTDSSAVVLFTALVCQEAKDTNTVRIRVSASCVEDKDGFCRIASIHASTAEVRQAEGEFFPAAPIGHLESGRDVGEKSLDILGQNIPGGMMGGYLEPGYPLYYVNQYLLDYLGYTYTEFVEATDGQVHKCMHPDDRAYVDEKVIGELDNGRSYEVQYRMRKKDGSYIWVNDVGKKGLSEDGRVICISVIRDISAEVESRERLEKQAARYDQLFQSVLTGIVQYRVSDNELIFKNANQEAIKIFGYTPAEFWEKKGWDLPGLIAQEDRSRVLADISRLQSPGDMMPFEYRMIQKDGTYCWIIGRAEVIVDTDGEQVIQSVFMDINDWRIAEERSRELAEQVEASNEILHLALAHTTICEFYYDPQTGTCTVPERTRNMYRCKDYYTDMPGSFAAEQVDPQFQPVFYELYERIHRGEYTASCELRLKDRDIWCRETLSVVRRSAGGAPRLVIGLIEDITRQKEMESQLKEAQSRDKLTGLYNKETGIRLIEDYLNSRPAGENGVLMIMDMDDFEDINRKEGNIFADAILQEVADILRAESGPDDIQIRLGGDEFMIFFKNCDKRGSLVKGPRIAALVKEILVDTRWDVHVSVSIGMCSTEMLDDYHALYRCAESTLEYVKEHGKGQAACFQETSDEAGMLLTRLYSEEHPVNEIGRGSAYEVNDLISFALDLLGKAKNLDDAVNLLLARIGKICGFDRVSIIECDRAYLTYRFSYQWARRHEDFQLGEDFYISEEDFDLCANMYDEDGLADHNLREGISDILSCLHAGIWDYGEYVGSMSFEVDQMGYRWTKEHRKLLKEMVKIIPSFIMKSKADAVSQAKTNFLSRMSHEIRTPMNAISGMTTIAKSVVNDPVKLMECLDKIESSNVYLLQLVNDILDMSRIESGKMELNFGTLDLTQLLESLKSLFYSQAMEKGLTLHLQDGRVCNRLILGDSLRLNQVLVNIIGNAVKFTNTGGITVCVEELEATPQSVLRFSVADSGIGIEPASLRRIFNPFEQAEIDTAFRQGGTGLGLSISYRLVQMMGGVLEVKSEVGKGSEFSFTLAFDYADDTFDGTLDKEEIKPAVSRQNFHGRRILLAEDNDLNREIAQTLLEMSGFEVVCAVNGKEALERYCEREPGWFDAVLMDIRMPVMDGLEASRRIRTSGRQDARTIPVIALTANAFNEDSKKSLESGMNGHLSKPVEVDKLLEVLEQCIGSRN